MVWRQHKGLVITCVLVFVPWCGVLGGKSGRNPFHQTTASPPPTAPPAPPANSGGSDGGPGRRPGNQGRGDPNPGHGPTQDMRDRAEIVLSPVKLAMQEALQACRKNNSHLLVLPEMKPSSEPFQDYLKHLQREFASHGIKEVWLGIELEDDRSASSESQEDPLCGLQYVDGRRDMESCFNTHTTICYKPLDSRNKDCDLEFSDTGCSETGESLCVAMEKNAHVMRTWFQAKQDCGKIGANVLPQTIWENKNVLSCVMNFTNPPGPVWLDESEVNWFWLPRNKKVSQDETRVRHFDWGPGAPSESIKKCVKLVLDSGQDPSVPRDSDTSEDDASDDEPGWYDEDCTKELHFICMDGSSYGMATSSHRPDNRDTRREKNPDPEMERRPDNDRTPPKSKEEPNGLSFPKSDPGQSMGQKEPDDNIEIILYTSIPIATTLVILTIIGAVCYIQWSRRHEKRLRDKNVVNALSNPGYTHYDETSLSSMYQSLDESRLDPLVNTDPYTGLRIPGDCDAQGGVHDQGEGHIRLEREDSDYYSEITAPGTISREPSQRTISESGSDQGQSGSQGDEEPQPDVQPKVPVLSDQQIKNNFFYDAPRPVPDYLELLPEEPTHDNIQNLAAQADIVLRDNSRSHAHVRDRVLKFENSGHKIAQRSKSSTSS